MHHLNTLPVLQQLMGQQSQSPLSSGRKRSSSDVCSSNSTTSSDCSTTSSSSEESPMKRLRQTVVGYETKVQPSKVGLSRFAANDVLSGRGGGTNQHEGNCFFRSLINKNRERYLRAKKNDK